MKLYCYNLSDFDGSTTILIKANSEEEAIKILKTKNYFYFNYKGEPSKNNLEEVVFDDEGIYEIEAYELV